MKSLIDDGIMGTIIIFTLIFLIRQSFLHAYLSNHTFVFISGWPQSGTSFLHQLLSQNQLLLSTMIPLCEKILGMKRCQSWNHEGQWMIDGKLRDLIHAGNVCPVPSIEESKRKEILAEWSKYWSLDKPFLIEKSPQNFVKIPMLRQLFQEAKAIKVIIVLKHPVTLNIATIKDTSWKYRKIVEETQKIRRDLSKIEIHQNFKHFIELMTHRSNLTQTVGCSMGWLPAMNLLFKFLQANRNFTDKNVKIGKPNRFQPLFHPSLLTCAKTGIMRFETLIHPVTVCIDLFKFILDEKFAVYQSSIIMMCNRILPPSVNSNNGRVRSHPSSPSSGSSFQSQKSFVTSKSGGPKLKSKSMTPQRSILSVMNESNSEEGMARRQLRLRNGKDPAAFVFRPELVKENGVKRIQEFMSVFQPSAIPKPIYEQVMHIHHQLLQYGYQLGDFTPVNSKFADWEL